MKMTIVPAGCTGECSFLEICGKADFFYRNCSKRVLFRGLFQSSRIITIIVAKSVARNYEKCVDSRLRGLAERGSWQWICVFRRTQILGMERNRFCSLSLFENFSN